MAQGNRPTHVLRARTGQKDKDQKDVFVDVGAAWQWNNNKPGFNLKIDTLPIGFDGYLLMAEFKEKE
jgi:hypothetical protein